MLEGKKCLDCKFCFICIGSAPDGKWAACDDFVEGDKKTFIERALKQKANKRR